jgi:hypothetical protein
LTFCFTGVVIFGFGTIRVTLAGYNIISYCE